MVLNAGQFGEQDALFPKPKFPGNARGFVGPHKAPTQPDTPNKHGVYLRFGDWRADERSNNWAFGGHEEGVSVYDMKGPHAEPEDPDPHDERHADDVDAARQWHKETYGTEDDFDPEDHADSIRGNDTGAEMRDRRMRGYRDATYDGQSFYHPDEQKPAFRGHFVKGTLVGFGHDNEPLLHDVKHVGAWPQDAHRFVPGTQGELFSHFQVLSGGRTRWGMKPDEAREIDAKLKQFRDGAA